MTLRNTTIDNSVRYIHISEKEEKKVTLNEKKIKAGTLPRKQNKNILQNSKKFP